MSTLTCPSWSSVYADAKNIDDEFTPKKVETIRDIRNEFKKFNKTKKHTKQLVAKISDAVAV